MKKRRADIDCFEKRKLVKKTQPFNMKNENNINKLPKVLIRYISNFTDFDSLINLSSVNQIYRNIFLELRKVFCFLKDINFIKFFRKTEKNIFLKMNALKQFLVEKNYSKMRDVYGDNPLHYACNNLSVEMIKYFVENKTDINSKNFNDVTPLHYICKHKSASLENIKYFIENKAELNNKNISDNTPLHYACNNKNISLDLVQYLIEQKSDIYLNNIYDFSPLFFASKNLNLQKQTTERFGLTKNIEELMISFLKY